MPGISNEALLAGEVLEDAAGATGTVQQAEKFLVCDIGNDFAAIPASVVREILINQDLYPLPFQADFVAGLLNYHGDPCAVIDFARMLDPAAKTDGNKFIVLKPGLGGLALRIVDVERIIRVPHQDISPWPDTTRGGGLFASLLRSGQTDIPIIDIEAVVAEIRRKTAQPG